ncbi:MAG TPA: MFS transporter [Streptosporangiaceae bacterium]|nr:MFS transporter [Streptosporangiaceae bacterium]
MIASDVSTKDSTVDRRLQATGMPIEVSIAVLGGLILLVADAWGLSLIPLVGNLEKTYSLSPSEAAWTLSVPGLVAAGFVPTVARLGDRLGMRPLILASLAVGLLGNILCALASGFDLLLIGRAILGASAALPLVYALLRARGTNAGRVTRGVAILTAASGVGVAVAYLMSGLIIQANGSVRTVFWVITILAAISFVVAWFYMPDSHHRQTEPIDWGGAVGVCVGLVFVVLAITEGNTWGWTQGSTLASLLGGLVVLGIFAFYETRQANPLINVVRISNRVAAPSFFVIAILGTGAIYTNLAQATYTELPTVTGYGLGLTVLQASLALCAISLALLVGGMVAHPVINRFGPRPVMVVSSLIIAANFLVLAYAHNGVWHFIVWDFIWGFVWAFDYTAAITAFLHDATPGEAAMYSSANTVITSAVGGLGPAVFTAILTSKFIPHTPIPDPSVFKQMWIYAAIAMVVVAVVALLIRRPTFVGEHTASDAAVTPGEAPSPSGPVAAGPEPA